MYYKSHIIHTLYSIFLEQVKLYYHEEFSGHLDYTGNFEKDKLKDSFGRQLKSHIEIKTKVVNPFNHRTLINIVNNGIAINAKTQTLNIIAQYMGYSDFDKFCLSVPKQKPKKRIYFWLAAAVLVAICTIGAVFILPTETEENKILETIKQANKTQFEAYQKLPEVYTQELKKYYTSNGNGYKVIEDILKRSVVLNRSISLPDGNPSYYNIHSTKILSKKENEAIVETKEHWYLRWYNMEDSVYVKKYDVTNTQIYILHKLDGVWKIDGNDYSGDPKEIK